jgi:hypothetical protein
MQERAGLVACGSWIEAEQDRALGPPEVLFLFRISLMHPQPCRLHVRCNRQGTTKPQVSCFFSLLHTQARYSAGRTVAFNADAWRVMERRCAGLTDLGQPSAEELRRPQWH